MSEERFTSRWGLIVAALGIAVGTGNIWRFPRIAALNGGGSFLIPWVVFLFLWSIPLIILELGIGRLTRYGPPGSFAILLGKRWAWLGGFVAVVTTAIMFYYAVVTGWCLRYLLLALSGRLLSLEDPAQDWNAFLASGWQPALFHLLAVGLAALIIRRGVVAGIEATCRWLVPALFVLVLLCAVRAVTLPGAERGLAFLFTPDWALLLNHQTWLHALTQNAWDTGAGWGLILTYGTYLRRREDIPLNASLVALGNNSVSLLAGIMVFCTVFAVVPGQADQLIREPGPLNTGLTFVWLPELFSRIPGGPIFVVFFFAALSFAAVSSLVAMVELATRVFIDCGWTRRRAVRLTFLLGALGGLPSAWSPAFFLNQDWVWGVALLLNGALIAYAVRRFGLPAFLADVVNAGDSDLHLRRWFEYCVLWAIPVQFVILLAWWFGQAALADPANWWNPFRVDSVGTCLLQWGGVAFVLYLFNRKLVSRMESA
ncbi:MAG: sodium-dependent transporter [Acidobacteriota bacterium]